MRYSVNDLPMQGLGAFAPQPTRNPIASSFGEVVRWSNLGIVPVAVNPPPRDYLPPLSRDPKTQGSNCAPDYILPSIWVTTADNMGPAADAGIGMTVRRLAPLPIPAQRIIYSPQSAFSSRKIGGRAQAAMPRAFQRFPNRTQAVQ